MPVERSLTMETIVFERILKRIRSAGRRFVRREVEHRSPEPWRFELSVLDDFWTRAALVHFPGELRMRSDVSGMDFAGTNLARPQPESGPMGDFQGFRPYEPGDDPRDVDWRATARARQPMVRERSTESRLSVTVIVDVSASMWVVERNDRSNRRPVDMAFEAALWLSAAALYRQSPLRLMLVSDRVERVLPRLHGRNAIRRVISELRGFRPNSTRTDWAVTFTESSGIRSGSYVFWISDFLWLPDPLSFRRSVGRFRNVGIRVVSRQLSNHSPEALLHDVETGSLVRNRVRSADLHQSERVRCWSVEAAVPVLELPVDAERPEYVLGDWLVGMHPDLSRRTPR